MTRKERETIIKVCTHQMAWNDEAHGHINTLVVMLATLLEETSPGIADAILRATGAHSTCNDYCTCRQGDHCGCGCSRGEHCADDGSCMGENCTCDEFVLHSPHAADALC